MNLQARVELYLKGVLTRTELLASFLDCVAEHPSSVATFNALLPSDFTHDIQRFEATPEGQWVSSIYPRGIASGEVTVRSPGSCDPTEYAIATLRAIQSLSP